MSKQRDKLVEALRGLAFRSPKIEIAELGTSLFATVVSGTFAGMDEAERQRLVWDGLRAALTEAEAATIEFVFTVAPGEDAEFGERAG